MAKKMGKRLLGICGVAVTAVYAAGYIYTMPSAQASATSASLPATSASAPASTGASANATATSSASASNHSKHTSKQQSSSSPTRKSSQSSAAKYKDGTYTGTGTNAYGTCSVAVTIQHGKITSAKITNYVMHYPQYYIDPQLPQEVVSMQTWQIYIVSGATASTYNFAEAVYYALQKAKA